MDTDRELDLLCIKAALSGKNMLIDAVDQRAIRTKRDGSMRIMNASLVLVADPRDPATAEQD
jgi:hypothetical protein